MREITLASGMVEELKWGVPCYTCEGHNVVIIHGFKDFVALNFFKGSLMKDPHQLLVAQSENMQASRQIRFTSVAEIESLAPVLAEYLAEGMAVEKAGLQVEYKKTEEFPVPDELTQAFSESPEFAAAFAALTPGRQRGYLLHFAGAKQSQTRAARIEKARPRIVEGKGLQG